MQQPNILFIQCDQLSANALGYAGCPYVQTPHLDRLARQSLNFREACCAFPNCVPSRPAWTYGRMPHELFLPGTELDYDARPGDPSRGVRPAFHREGLGHWFKAAGYRTAFAGKWHVGQWGPTESLRPEFDGGFEILSPIHDPGTTLAASRFLASHSGDRPFLLVSSYDNPHNICEYAAGTPLPWGPLPPEPSLQDLPPCPGNLQPQPHEPSAIRQRRRLLLERSGFDATDWRRYRWAYYRLVEKLDAEIGRLLDALDSSPHASSTVVVFTSDHGDMQGAHGLTEKDTLYEEAVRVPYLIRSPEPHSAGVSDHLVNNALDTYPTLCDLAGLRPPSGLHGHSLVPLLRGGHAAGPDFTAAELKYRFGGGEARMIRTARWKYICHDTGPVREQLFDLCADPHETENLAVCSTFAPILTSHRERLRTWLSRTHDPFGEKHYAFPTGHTQMPGDHWPLQTS